LEIGEFAFSSGSYVVFICIIVRNWPLIADLVASGITDELTLCVDLILFLAECAF
jgi:hypothetical protein